MFYVHVCSPEGIIFFDSTLSHGFAEKYIKFHHPLAKSSHMEAKPLRPESAPRLRKERWNMRGCLLEPWDGLEDDTLKQ